MSVVIDVENGSSPIISKVMDFIVYLFGYELEVMKGTLILSSICS